MILILLQILLILPMCARQNRKLAAGAALAVADNVGSAAAILAEPLLCIDTLFQLKIISVTGRWTRYISSLQPPRFWATGRISKSSNYDGGKDKGAASLQNRLRFVRLSNANKPLSSIILEQKFLPVNLKRVRKQAEMRSNYGSGVVSGSCSFLASQGSARSKSVWKMYSLSPAERTMR